MKDSEATILDSLIDLLSQLSSPDLQRELWIVRADPSVFATFEEAVEGVYDLGLEPTVASLAERGRIPSKTWDDARSYALRLERFASRLYQTGRSYNPEFYARVLADPEWPELCNLAAEIKSALVRARRGRRPA